jgi:hypothetical protein
MSSRRFVEMTLNVLRGSAQCLHVGLGGIAAIRSGIGALRAVPDNGVGMEAKCYFR